MNKFRVYDKQRGRDLTDAEAGDFFINSKGEFCCVEYDYMGQIERISPFPSERFIVREFTGFHDSKGREVYEGDRVKDPHFGICVIEWNKYEGSWDYMWVKDGEERHQTHLLASEVADAMVISTIRDREDA